MSLSNMCNIAHVKTTKSGNFLLNKKQQLFIIKATYI